MAGARRPNVFTIAPGVSFLPAIARALINGEVIDGFDPSADPLALANTTIYVPTRRAARALASEILRCLPGDAAILPRIVPLGQMENIETGLLLDDSISDDLSLGLAPAIGDIARRTVLTRLILDWSRSLKRAIVSVDENDKAIVDPDEALLVATSPPQAWRLAGELAGLIDEMIIEGVAWDALRPLATDEFDPYWRITLEFLKIAAQAWPNYLVEIDCLDAAARQVLLVEAEVARLDRGENSDAPVIAIGSTGTNKATAHLLAAIARAPRGAVVLPGLDLRLDEESWTQIGGDVKGAGAAASHPQSALWRLLPVLGIAREDVRPLGIIDPLLAMRDVFLSEAMRPAETTDRWRAVDKIISAEKIVAALADVAIVEAADQREEALALAISIREALEIDGATIALATPDRSLAQRVQAELARWDIDVDDSGGDSLGTTLVGALARLAIACADETEDARLLALISHSLACFGRTRKSVEHLGRLLEGAVLRQPIKKSGKLAERILLAKTSAVDRHAHPALQAVSADEWIELAHLAQEIDEALAPLRLLHNSASLADWIEAHRRAIVNVMAGSTEHRLQADARETLETLLADLAASASMLPEAMEADVYAAFFDQLAAEAIVRGPRRSHPRVKILGLLEARLLDADFILLGGLDETIWPPQAKGDPFLNRPMREQLGLSPPERRLGQTAHDFVQLMGSRRVLISRSAKRDGSPTVPSRFLQRMKAIAGQAVWDDCVSRGKRLQALAEQIDRPAAPIVLPPPLPKPPVDLRPTSLSVTRVETLRRDPYSIYAERILRLKPLDGLAADLGPRETGTIMHEIVANFVVDFPHGALPPGAGQRLIERARKAFRERLEDAEFRTFFWPRIEATLVSYVEWEGERRADLVSILVEQTGSLDLTLADGSRFRLSAQADRIEKLRDGTIALIDFKTGAPPSPLEINVGFAPQLTLEAAIVERGGFAAIPAGSVVSDARYIKLLAKDDIGVRKVGDRDPLLDTLVTDHFAGLLDLLNEFRSPDRSYPSRPYVKFIHKYAEYDHLARVKEWSAGNRESGSE